nr:MAG TPA: hypothetical protein [Caudoviricetes sp.]
MCSFVLFIKIILYNKLTNKKCVIFIYNNFMLVV